MHSGGGGTLWGAHCHPPPGIRSEKPTTKNITIGIGVCWHGDLFVGALVPGLLLVTLYIIYLLVYLRIKPQAAPVVSDQQRPPWSTLFAGLLPPILLIVTVLGSILAGAATPTEAAGVGALGATLLAAIKR